jgi:hypothetical protein
MILNIFILFAVFFSAFMSTTMALSKDINENGSIYIVDIHGERWDVTQAKSIGFLPERFQHGIGRNAFLPLDDSNLTTDDRNLSKNARVIGISDGKEANAYSVRRLWRHEIANSTIGEQPIAAAY